MSVGDPLSAHAISGASGSAGYTFRDTRGGFPPPALTPRIDMERSLTRRCPTCRGRPGSVSVTRAPLSFLSRGAHWTHARGGEGL